MADPRDDRVSAAYRDLPGEGPSPSLDAAIQLTTGDADSLQLLTAHRDLLPELFIVSQVEVTASADADGGVAVSVRHAQELGYHRCPRCWRWVPQLCTTPHGEVCPRCSEAL